MAIQRAYPRLLSPTFNQMEMQKILNQMCDWIFQLQSSSGGSVSGSTSSGSVVKAFSTADLDLLHDALLPAPGVSIQLSPGSWLIFGIFQFVFGSTTAFPYGGIDVNGNLDLAFAITGAIGAGAGAQEETVVRMWSYDLPSGATVIMRAATTNLHPGAKLLKGLSGLIALKVG